MNKNLKNAPSSLLEASTRTGHTAQAPRPSSWARPSVRNGVSLLLSLGALSTAVAQTNVDAPGTTTAADAQAAGTQAAPAPTGLWDRPALFGDMGGLRPWLGNY